MENLSRLEYRGIYSGISFIAGRNVTVSTCLDDIWIRGHDNPPSYSEANALSQLDLDKLPSYNELFPCPAVEANDNTICSRLRSAWRGCFSLLYSCWYIKTQDEVSI
jgi:hypothetical protein